MAEEVTYIQGSEEHYRFLVDRLGVDPLEARVIVEIEAGRGGDVIVGKPDVEELELSLRLAEQAAWGSDLVERRPSPPTGTGARERYRNRGADGFGCDPSADRTGLRGESLWRGLRG